MAAVAAVVKAGEWVSEVGWGEAGGVVLTIPLAAWELATGGGICSVCCAVGAGLPLVWGLGAWWSRRRQMQDDARRVEKAAELYREAEALEAAYQLDGDALKLTTAAARVAHGLGELDFVKHRVPGYDRTSLALHGARVRLNLEIQNRREERELAAEAEFIG
jgi:hypothetical protein